MNYRIVEREAFQVVGVKREIPCTGEGGSPSSGIAAFWSEAISDGTVNQLIEINNGQIKGLLGVTHHYNKQNNTIEYWIAAEHSGDVSARYESFVFAASRWAVFEVRGPIPNALVNTWKHVFSEWFPANEYEKANIPPFEAYIDSNLYSPNSLNELWVAIK